MNHPKTETVYETKHRLYRQYVEEQNQFTPRKIDAAGIESRGKCDALINDPYISWRNLFFDNQIVGFLILARAGAVAVPVENGHAIAAIYVEPDMRRRGIATKAVIDYLVRHRDVYCVSIPKENTTAVTFLENRFSDTDYIPMQAASAAASDGADENIDLMWKPGREPRR